MIIVFPILCGASSQEQLRHIQQVKGRILISENCEWTLALLLGGFGRNSMCLVEHSNMRTFLLCYAPGGSYAAFAALREDDVVITWGNPGGGGDIHMHDLE